MLMIYDEDKRYLFLQLDIYMKEGCITMHYEPSADGIMWEVTLTDISYPPQEKHKCVEIGWITEIDDFTNYNSLHNGHIV